MTAPPKWTVYLRLGRVSNLPTIWTNVVTGVWLSGARPGLATVALLAAAMSFFYAGGMFLNDAFDRKIDARQRPERPIPAGHVRAVEVFAAGYGLLAAGELTLAAHCLIARSSPAPLLSGLGLAAAIIAYDRWHKQNPASPLLMGLCRVLVYITAALAVRGDLSAEVLGGAAVLWVYLIGLTYIAKRGNPRAVPLLIAGISLLDALMVAFGGGSSGPALLTALGFPATLLLQRYVRGT